LTVALSLALVFNALSLALLASPASAASLTSMSDTMTRQDAGVDSSHTIRFTLDAGTTIVESETITITFEDEFEELDGDGAGLGIEDIDLLDDGSDEDLVNALGAADADEWGVDITNYVLTLTAPTTAATYIDGSSAVTVEIGLGADTEGTGDTEIANPTPAGTYYDVSIAGTFGDTGTILIPILDDDFVTISATIQSNIWFDLDIDDDDTTLHHDESAAPYEVDLGTLIFTTVTDENTGGVDEIYLDLSTNASGGAVVEFYSVNTSLDSSSSGGSIVSATESLTANTTDGGYGVDADEVGAGQDSGTFQVDATYNAGASPAVVAVPSAWDTIFDSSGAAVQGGDGRINVRAISGTETPAANDYTDTLYFRATATF